MNNPPSRQQAKVRFKDPLTKKYIAEGMLLFAAIATGVFIFCWFRVWVVGEFDTAQFRQIIDLLPKDWRKFASVDFDWLVSYLGRTSLTLDEPMLVMLVCAWGLVRGSDVVSGEIGRGTMEMLLSQPIGRRQLYLKHARLTIFFLGLLVCICWLAMSLGIWTTSVEESTYPEIRIPVFDYRIPLSFLPARTETVAMGSVVNPIAFLPGLINLFCLGFCLSGFAAFCSSLDRYRWRTLGIAAAFFFSNVGMKVMGMGSEKLAWIKHCSVFGQFHPARAIEQVQSNPWALIWLVETGPDGEWVDLGILGNCLILLTLGTLLYWIGLRIFIKRDVPAPM
ncbi:MAG: ABC transporter permease subunit [Mariniblastus sp.]|nr:ABC transporter permease subunit [Mariniblastus sp.]